jgi:hypothetical protein
VVFVYRVHRRLRWYDPYHSISAVVTPYEELRLLLSSIPEQSQGEKQLCPFCGGGRKGERSLDIFHHQGGSGAYQCKRAQCGKEGYIGDSFGTHYTPQQRPKEFEPRIFDGLAEDVPEDVREYYLRKYGWSREDFDRTGCRWSYEYHRTVWQVRAPDGTLRGIELRSHYDKDRAKTLHYRHTSEPWIGYVGVGRTQGCLVAVEDLLSAHRVSSVYPAASIMGSHLTFDMLMDMTKVSENIVLCLDRDATEKAAKIVKRYAFICPGLVHVPLLRDLKYENKDSIEEILKEAIDSRR